MLCVFSASPGAACPKSPRAARAKKKLQVPLVCARMLPHPRSPDRRDATPRGSSTSPAMLAQKGRAPPPTHPPVHQKALQTQQAHSDTKTTTSKTTPEIALRRPQGDALGSQSQYSQPQQAVPPHAPLRSASAFLPSGGVSAQFWVGYPWVSVGIRGYPPPFVRQRYASCIMKVSKTQGAGAMRGSNLEFQRGIRPGEANAL